MEIGLIKTMRVKEEKIVRNIWEENSKLELENYDRGVEIEGKCLKIWKKISLKEATKKEL